MKTIGYYEVNQNAPSQTLFEHFPTQAMAPLIRTAREVFDYLNTVGPASVAQIGEDFKNTPRLELSQAVRALLNFDLISRKSLSVREDE